MDSRNFVGHHLFVLSFDFHSVHLDNQTGHQSVLRVPIYKVLATETVASRNILILLAALSTGLSTALADYQMVGRSILSKSFILESSEGSQCFNLNQTTLIRMGSLFPRLTEDTASLNSGLDDQPISY